MVMDYVDGQWRTYCRKWCHWQDKYASRETYNGRETPAMGKMTGKREWETLYHGWDLADVVKDLDARCTTCRVEFRPSPPPGPGTAVIRPNAGSHPRQSGWRSRKKSADTVVLEKYVPLSRRRLQVSGNSREKT